MADDDQQLAAVPYAAAPPATDVRVRAVAGELIETAEVDKAEEDRLGHDQIAQQLADLAVSVPDRSNIALYGAWGSGKTGIGNLVRRELAGRKGIGFARFDAFKYAENPLRRNFISAVATELEIIDDPKFHSDLYTGQTRTTFDIPKESVVKIAAIFLGLSFAICLSLLGLAAAVSAVQSGDFTANLRALARQAVVAALTPAALLSALVVLAGKSLGVERKTDKAESSEQFEALFSALIKEAGKDRVVVFVDELDRCAPSDVVATLDAVRTFLGNDGCVFIVAADPAAIEEALQLRLPQATPADRVNPYYSSGSAYLDKVFHNQIHVPPLLQASVTRYAADLVRDRPGVWAELGDRLDLTVSVAVPSHVRSPRRVKALLNAFVLAYRLAEARQLSGRLHGDVRKRADEIARLVCLRTEFPVFARDLVLDARLPEYVLRLHSGEEPEQVWAQYPHATDEVRGLAQAYACVRLPVAPLLIDDDQDEVEAGESSVEGSAAGGEESDRDVKHALGRQLLDYLSRTRSVAGPSRDLLYMQSTGSEVGLDGELAERIEQDAANGSVRELLASTEWLGPDEHDAVITLLIEQSRRALGLEARNVAVSLLAVAGTAGFDVTTRADALADALAPAVNAEPGLIDAAGLPGAWQLGLHSDRPTATDLRRLVIRSDAAREDLDVAALVLARPDAALDADPEMTARLLARNLLSPAGDDASRIADVLLAADPEAVTRLLRASADALAEGLRELFAPPPDLASAAPPAAGAALPRAAAAPAADAAVSPAVDPAPVAAALAGLLERLDDAPAQALLGIVLAVDDMQARSIAEKALDRVGLVTDPALAVLVLRAATRRSLASWPRWLAPLAPPAVQDPAAAAALQGLVDSLWRVASNTKDRPGDPDVRAAAAAVVAVLEHLPPGEVPTPAGAVQRSLGGHVEDDDTAETRLDLLAVAAGLVRAGVLGPDALVTKESADVAATLALQLPEQGADDPIVRYVTTSVPECLRGGPGSGVQAPPPPDRARELADAVHACAWLPEPHATRLRLLARAALAGNNDGLPALPSADAMEDLRHEHGRGVDDTIAVWIDLAAPSPEGLLAVTTTALSEPSPSAGLVASLRRRADALTSKERADVLAGLLADVNDAPPGADVLAAAGAASLPDAEVARILVARAEKCTNIPQRRHVLDAWEGSGVRSDPARKLLFQKVLIPLFDTKDNGGSGAAHSLGLEYLPRLARTRPAGTNKALRDAVVRAVGEDRAAKPLKAIGYRVSKSWFGLKTNIDTD